MVKWISKPGNGGMVYISNERNHQSLMFGHTDQQDTASTTVVPTTGTVLFSILPSVYSYLGIN